MTKLVKVMLAALGVFFISLLAVNCTKNQKEKVQMTYEQLSAKIGNVTAFALFEKEGLTEADPAARGARKVKAGSTLSTLSDLTLTNEGGGNLKTTLSVNWMWAGINNGAAQSTTITPVSFCNVTNPSESHPETATGVLICNATATGTTIGWTSDADGTVHLSNTL